MAKAGLGCSCNRKGMGRKQRLGEIWSANLLTSPASKEMTGSGGGFSLLSSATSLHTPTPPSEATTASQIMTSPLSTTSWKTQHVTPKESDFLVCCHFKYGRRQGQEQAVYNTKALRGHSCMSFVQANTHPHNLVLAFRCR